MAREFTLDTSKLEAALLRSEKDTSKGIKRGLIAIKNDWVADAVDLAPMDTGNLRKQISGKVDNVGVMVTANAMNGDFNYGYYIHEVRGDEFLDLALDEANAQETLEREVIKALREAGF